ncbi:HtaA domain-containing protein [Leucobacter ruminantium]|uniref:HtaA domain-containing protein n=1 Tax=Leucobacter ruminantium TaxID=1289170 RepID=A0A939LVS7_9MICO|nr:HtaA domain-containing protein [Leucobacter ruminantium]MBO1805332.1 HtaA domain-containing protein [Leucobacter ruminantium]
MFARRGTRGTIAALLVSALVAGGAFLGGSAASAEELPAAPAASDAEPTAPAPAQEAPAPAPAEEAPAPVAETPAPAEAPADAPAESAPTAPQAAEAPAVEVTETSAQAATITSEVTGASETGLTVSVRLDGVTIPAGKFGAYLGVIERDRVGEYGTDSGAGMVEVYFRPGDFVNGSVTREITVPKDKLDSSGNTIRSLDRSKEYVLVSWFAHGFLTDEVKIGQQDLAVSSAQWDLVFPPAVPVASVAGEVTGASETGLTVSVRLDGVTIPAGKFGAYLGVIEKDRVGEYGSDAGAGMVEAYLRPSDFVNGSVAREITVPREKLDRTSGAVIRSLDPTKEYVLVSWFAHGFLTDEVKVGQQDLAVSSAQWDLVFPPATPTPAVSVAVKSASETGLVVTADVSGLDRESLPNGVHVGVLPASVNPEAAIASDFLATGTMTKTNMPESGAFTLDVFVPVAKLTKGQELQVLVWKRHTNPAADTNLADSALVVSSAQWDQVFPPTEPATPSVAVSKTAGVDPGGETITVIGSGFTPNPPATDGTRMPLKGKFGGAYVQFGYYDGATWKGGSTSSPELTRWAVSPEDVAALGAAAIPVVDGAFEAELKPVPVAGAPEGAVYGIRTYGGSGSTYAPFSTFTAITFAEPEPAGAQLNVSKSSGLDPEGEEITVTGSGYEINPSGVYVQIGWIIEGEWTPVSDADTRSSKRASAYSSWIGSGFPGQPGWTKADDGTGSFSWTVTVDKAALDAKKLEGGTLAVFTLGAHGNWVQPANERFVPISFTQKAAAVSGTVIAADSTGLDVRVAGADLLDAQVEDGLTVAIVEKGKSISGDADAVRYVFLPKGAVVAGKFETELKAAPSKLDRNKQYEVLAFGGADWSRIADRKIASSTIQVSAQNWEAVFGQVKPSVNAVASVSASGLEVKVTAKNLPTDGEVYGALIERGTENGLSMDGGYAAFALPFPVVKNGASTFTLLATKDKLDPKKQYEVIIWRQHSTPDASTIYTRGDVSITQEQWNKLAGTTAPDKPTPPAPAPPVADASGKRAGSLSWGVSSAFASYVTGRIAKGSVSAQGVCGAYVFGQSSSWDSYAQTGIVSYSGVVSYRGHGGLLSETFSNPVINTRAGTISAGGHTFGLSLGAPVTNADGSVTWSGVPVAGGISGGGNGGGGTLGMDSLSFTVGAAGAVNCGGSSVTSAFAPQNRKAASKPPTTSGITVLTDAEDLVPGGEIEIEASGFEPDERDILVVMYSDPIVLDEHAGANKSGIVRWIGTIPEDIEPGEHTITLQGSIDVGQVITVLDKKKAAEADKASKKISGDTARIDATQAMSAGLGDTGAPLWVWWSAAIALLLIAGATSGLVIAQRRKASGE